MPIVMPKPEEGVSLGNYRIFETNEFSRKLERITPPDSQVIRKKLRDHVYPRLREEPTFGKNIKKLRGYTPETWRYRIGKFRIFYSIDDKDRIVFILTIDQRKDIYK